MAADFSPLDTTQRAKVMAILSQLADSAGSDQELMDAYNRVQGLGRQNLSDYFNQAGMAIGGAFEPQFDQARNMLGASPLLADSGYGNRLNHQLLSDLGARLAGQYGEAAANQANQNTGFLQNLYQNRFNTRGDLARGAYSTMTALPRKQGLGSQIAKGALTLGGAALGAFTGGAHAAAGNLMGSMQTAADNYEPQQPSYRPMPYNPPNYQQLPPQSLYTPRPVSKPYLPTRGR